MNKAEHDDLAQKLLTAHRLHRDPCKPGGGFTTALRVTLRLLIHLYDLTKVVEQLESRIEELEKRDE